jgi:hypothetical protein
MLEPLHAHDMGTGVVILVRFTLKFGLDFGSLGIVDSNGLH